MGARIGHNRTSGAWDVGPRRAAWCRGGGAWDRADGGDPPAEALRRLPGLQGSPVPHLPPAAGHRSGCLWLRGRFGDA